MSLNLHEEQTCLQNPVRCFVFSQQHDSTDSTPVVIRDHSYIIFSRTAA